MRGLDPRIHLLCKRVFTEEGWIAGSSPAMTILKIVSMCAAKSHNNTKEESNGQQAR
jgi:hypothetical protein